jgi:hypothetical protein
VAHYISPTTSLIYSQVKHVLTLRKYRFGFPSGRIWRLLQSLSRQKHRKIPKKIFVPLGITVTTALWRGKLPSIPTSQSEESPMIQSLRVIEYMARKVSRLKRPIVGRCAHMYHYAANMREGVLQPRLDSRAVRYAVTGARLSTFRGLLRSIFSTKQGLALRCSSCTRPPLQLSPIEPT